MDRFDKILWDVDGTLLDFLYSQRVALTACLGEIGIPATEELLETYSKINDSYWKQLELGRVTKEQLLTGRFSTFFETCRIEAADPISFQHSYEERLGQVYKYQENAYEICRFLHGRVKQYVITNGITRVQNNKLKLSGLAAFFDGIFISEQIGTPKPGKEFFDFCMEQIGKDCGEAVEPGTMLIVGDSLTSDIKGGILYGIPTCWYRPETADRDNDIYRSYKPDYEIDRLEQIMELLGLEDIWQNQKNKN